MSLKLRETYKVQFDMIDYTGKMSINGLSSYMQIIAGNHASILGFNYYKNSSTPEYYWILSRVKYEVETYPKWEDTVQMETYPGGYDKLYAVRLFDLYNEAGQKIAHIIGDYVLMDAKTNRPVKIKGSTGILAFLDFPYEGENLKKLKLPKEAIKVEKRKARYSEMDLNGHMNNAHYVRWTVDSLPIDVLEVNEISSLEVNYNAGITYGIEVNVALAQDEEGNFIVYGNSLDDTKNYFVSKVVLRKRK